MLNKMSFFTAWCLLFNTVFGRDLPSDWLLNIPVRFGDSELVSTRTSLLLPSKGTAGDLKRHIIERYYPTYESDVSEINVENIKIYYDDYKTNNNREYSNHDIVDREKYISCRIYLPSALLDLSTSEKRVEEHIEKISEIYSYNSDPLGPDHDFILRLFKAKQIAEAFEYGFFGQFSHEQINHLRNKISGQGGLRAHIFFIRTLERYLEKIYKNSQEEKNIQFIAWVLQSLTPEFFSRDEIYSFYGEYIKNIPPQFVIENQFYLPVKNIKIIVKHGDKTSEVKDVTLSIKAGASVYDFKKAFIEHCYQLSIDQYGIGFYVPRFSEIEVTNFDSHEYCPLDFGNGETVVNIDMTGVTSHDYARSLLEIIFFSDGGGFKHKKIPHIINYYSGKNIDPFVEKVISSFEWPGRYCLKYILKELYDDYKRIVCNEEQERYIYREFKLLGEAFIILNKALEDKSAHAIGKVLYRVSKRPTAIKDIINKFLETRIEKLLNSRNDRLFYEYLNDKMLSDCLSLDEKQIYYIECFLKEIPRNVFNNLDIDKLIDQFFNHHLFSDNEKKINRMQSLLSEIQLNESQQEIINQIDKIKDKINQISELNKIEKRCTIGGLEMNIALNAYDHAKSLEVKMFDDEINEIFNKIKTKYMSGIINSFFDNIFTRNMSIGLALKHVNNEIRYDEIPDILKEEALVQCDKILTYQSAFVYFAGNYECFIRFFKGENVLDVKDISFMVDELKDKIPVEVRHFIDNVCEDNIIDYLETIKQYFNNNICNILMRKYIISKHSKHITTLYRGALIRSLFKDNKRDEAVKIKNSDTSNHDSEVINAIFEAQDNLYRNR